MVEEKDKEASVETEPAPDEESLPVCTSAASAEHARAEEEDEPCDDARGDG